jgi:hypothetical protein
VTIQAQIEALESLAVIDSELKDLQDELGRERAVLQGRRQRLAELEERLGRDRTSLEDMERGRNELMTELRQMSLQVEKSREKLGRCRTEREANAAQREVEELRKLYRDRELEVEKLNVLIDQAKGDIEKTTRERDEVRGELGASEGDLTSRLGELEALCAQKLEARKEAVQRVRPQLYRRYELVRQRRGTAVAHTVQGTCSACHMRLPPMLFQQLKRSNDFGQCPSCNRILYVSNGAAADSQSSEP